MKVTGYKIINNFLRDGVMYYILMIYQNGKRIKTVEYPALALEFAGLEYGEELHGFYK